MRAFLSLPITVNLGDDGIFRDDRREFYAGMIRAMEAHQIEVVSAVLNEDWGRVQLPVEEFTRFDVDEILAADLLVVVSSEGLSRDIYLEIGIAVGKGVPVFVFVPQNTRQTYMLQGLRTMNLVRVLDYTDEQQAVSVLDQALAGWIRESAAST
ncbi:MAG: hypothetical protein RIK87_27845 [Fuerstiella sp.]